MNKYRDEPNWDLQPDLNRLHEECANQARIYHFYHDKLADAREELAVQERTLEVLESEMKLEIRRSGPDAYGLKKETRLTEELVDNLMRVTPRRAEQVQRLIQAKHEVDVLTGTIRALEQRKSMLEEIVKLRLADYFSEPTLPQKTRAEIEEEDRSRVFRPKQRKIHESKEG